MTDIIATIHGTIEETSDGVIQIRSKDMVVIHIEGQRYMIPRATLDAMVAARLIELEDRPPHD